VQLIDRGNDRLSRTDWTNVRDTASVDPAQGVQLESASRTGDPCRTSTSKRITR
jgi:hypothetical protein